MTTLLVWVAVAVCVLVIVVAGLGALRLRALTRRVGWFECGARREARPGTSWAQGIAHYGVGRIEWWPCWSMSLRPAQTWCRSELAVVGRSPATDGPGSLFVVSCTYRGARFELAMSQAAYAGLASWLEAAPPGRQGAAV